MPSDCAYHWQRLCPAPVAERQLRSRMYGSHREAPYPYFGRVSFLTRQSDTSSPTTKPVRLGTPTSAGLPVEELRARFASWEEASNSGNLALKELVANSRRCTLVVYSVPFESTLCGHPCAAARKAVRLTHEQSSRPTRLKRQKVGVVWRGSFMWNTG